MPVSASEIRDYVENTLRPLIQADGGEMRFISFKDGVLRVKMQGECSICWMAGSYLKEWIEGMLRQEFGCKFNVVPIRARPYFVDK